MIGLDTDSSGRVLIPVKAVPGASSDAIAGELGGRLKIRVSAPPEGGKANQAICRLLARRLGVRKSDLEIVAGGTNPEKLIAINRIDADTIRQRLGVEA